MKHKTLLSILIYASRKKYMRAISVITAILVGGWMCGNAQEAINGVYYSVNDDGEATICGVMDPTADGILKIPTHVELDGIVRPVTEIGITAMTNCKAQVILPETLKQILDWGVNGVRLQNELYLPNLQTIGPMAMAECTGVEKLIVGPQLNRIGASAFEGVEAKVFVMESGADAFRELWLSSDALSYMDASEIKLPENISIKMGDSFCNQAKRVVFPAQCDLYYCPQNNWSAFPTIHELTANLIGSCEEVVSLGQTPPEIEVPEDFSAGSNYYGQTSTRLHITGNMDECVLKVPSGSENLYRSHPIWGLFKNILGFEGDDYTSISLPEFASDSSDSNHQVEYYDLHGAVVKHPVHGQIYISRTGSHIEKIIF